MVSRPCPHQSPGVSLAMGWGAHGLLVMVRRCIMRREVRRAPRSAGLSCAQPGTLQCTSYPVPMMQHRPGKTVPSAPPGYVMNVRLGRDMSRRFAEICHDLTRFAGTRQDLPSFAVIRRDLPGCAKICRELPRYTEISRDFPRFTDRHLANSPIFT